MSQTITAAKERYATRADRASVLMLLLAAINFVDQAVLSIVASATVAEFRAWRGARIEDY